MKPFGNIGVILRQQSLNLSSGKTRISDFNFVP